MNLDQFNNSTYLSADGETIAVELRGAKSTVTRNRKVYVRKADNELFVTGFGSRGNKFLLPLSLDNNGVFFCEPDNDDARSPVTSAELARSGVVHTIDKLRRSNSAKPGKASGWSAPAAPQAVAAMASARNALKPKASVKAKAKAPKALGADLNGRINSIEKSVERLTSVVEAIAKKLS
jgi:hypothetical protein